jgi:3-deoxy-D-manno-octulosonic-acid transferase
VSAGEVVAAVPIVRELRGLAPNCDIYLSVTTPAGMEMAEQQARPFVDQLFYFPIDLPWVARSVVSQIKPRVFVSLESELWPNILHELKRRHCATIMVNGRISERNFKRARSLGRWFFRWMLSNMDRLLVQSQADAERILVLGGPQVKDRTVVFGNSKFDQEIAQLTAEEAADLRGRLKFPPNAPIFVAGSTRSAQEEAIVLRAYVEMRLEIESLCLLIAPRQVDRAGELAEAMRALGLEPVRRTVIDAAGSVSHMILDTMGELANIYAIAAIAFVGNSFEPVVKGGGQNLLQPLAHGKPVLFGPKTATIKSEVQLAVQSGVGFEVHSSEQLAHQGLDLLRDEAQTVEIGRRAVALIASQRGISRRYAEEVAALAGTAPDAAQ